MKLTKLTVTHAPHFHGGMTVSKVMTDVVIALAPASIMAVRFFGYRAALVMAVSIASAVLAEYIWQRYVIKAPSGISDMSAVVTGLLLALTLPPTMPLWQAAVGAAFAIIFAKQVFGGIGHNPFNPALAARAFLQIAWPSEMTSWIAPAGAADAVTAATPLAAARYQITEAVPALRDLFFGNVAGSLAETSAAALLAGAAYLVFRRQIKMIIPLVYIAVVAIFSAAYSANAIYQILAGGLILGAFFMATDPVTAPTTKKGMIIFGAGCGILTSLIRFSGGFPEGVCFSILIMNMTVPLIDRYTIPKPFGYSFKGKSK
ncbi:MAG: Na+-transporting NADH:ubiquinone oxidoreductase subunit D [Elusimicrobia bacterium HGW-Elusimicrobia-1]|nr:MAG: Na+-transporting NADH:ubiquinone oxidoreductase subunit D [Elusimicrobia bacterium HGW-Elusimicrobia-1]